MEDRNQVCNVEESGVKRVTDKDGEWTVDGRTRYLTRPSSAYLERMVQRRRAAERERRIRREVARVEAERLSLLRDQVESRLKSSGQID